MNNKMKKAVAIVCMGAAVLTLTPAVSMAETAALPVNHQQETAVSPRMMYIEDAKSNLTISGTKATVTASVSGDMNNATKAKVIAELQLKSGSSWIPVEIWTVTNSGVSAKVYETYTVKSNNTYRVKATVTVWEGSQSETKTVYSSEKTV